MEEKTISLLDLPTDITQKEIPSHLALKELSLLARTFLGGQTFFADALNNAKLLVLLQHVAFGEQEQAERILMKNPTLLLKTGQLTDYSGRTFKDITAFQYALWALDRHMWCMILKYLPSTEAAKQLYDHVYTKKDYKEMHGDYYDSTPLLDALWTYIAYLRDPNRTKDEIIEHWCKVVGGAQFLVPAHIANEHCRVDRLCVYPIPEFKEDNLPRTLFLHNYLIGSDEHWFTGLGSKPGAGRHVPFGACALNGQQSRTRAAGGEFSRCGYEDDDVAMVVALFKARTNELLELKEQLLPDPAQGCQRS